MLTFLTIVAISAFSGGWLLREHSIRQANQNQIVYTPDMAEQAIAHIQEFAPTYDNAYGLCHKLAMDCIAKSLPTPTHLIVDTRYSRPKIFAADHLPDLSKRQAVARGIAYILMDRQTTIGQRSHNETEKMNAESALMVQRVVNYIIDHQEVKK